METNHAITFEDVINGAPWWVCREDKNNKLPDDVFHRVYLSFRVSSKAMDNPDFDWRGFVLNKIHNTLKRIKARHEAKFLTIDESRFFAKVERETDATVFTFCFYYTFDF